MILCECKWKYPETESECPRCGKPKPEDNMVRQWNSTVKADPSKKPKRSWIKPKKSDKKLQKAMREVGLQHLADNGGKAYCENCGLQLPELRYSNISHIKKRSTSPELREEVSNMEVLCSAQNFWGSKDESCHTVWERNDYEFFKELEGSREGEIGT